MTTNGPKNLIYNTIDYIVAISIKLFKKLQGKTHILAFILMAVCHNVIAFVTICYNLFKEKA